jgi:hypothetical protein
MVNNFIEEGRNPIDTSFRATSAAALESGDFTKIKTMDICNQCAKVRIINHKIINQMVQGDIWYVSYTKG